MLARADLESKQERRGEKRSQSLSRERPPRDLPCVTDMRDDAEAQEEGIPELERALIDRFFLGLVRQLRSQFDNVGSAQVEDAVAVSVERLLIRLQRGPVRDVRSYLAKSAFNELRKTASRRVEVALEERDDAEIPSAEDVVLRGAAIDLIRAEISTWENDHIKHVMFVYVDMLVANDVLETDEVADIVSVNLGEHISPMSVRTWKARGLRKLRQFIENEEAFGSLRAPAGEG